MVDKPVDPHEPCRVCRGTLSTAFHGVVLADVDATYCICTDCRSLIVPTPHWLERSYAAELHPDPDFGLLRRCLFIHRTLRRMRSVHLLPKPCRSLDYGAGKGILVRLLLDEAWDAWGYDPLATPLFAEDRILTELPSGPFDVITMIEVIEHLCDPVDTLGRLRSLLAPSGVMLLSTELFDHEIHGRSWHYLAPQHGQHITMLSRKGLCKAAERAGLRWVLSLRLSGIDFLHLMVHQDQQLSRLKLLRFYARQQIGERRACRDRYA
jgi:hypothetical protein